MANSKDTMGRLARIESDVHDLKGAGAVVRMTEILLHHSQQLTQLRRAVDGVNERLGGVNDRLDRLDGVNERLDRLIAVTMQERTASTERLGDIERRLARLEELVGT